jgi:hypothetical protein
MLGNRLPSQWEIYPDASMAQPEWFSYLGEPPAARPAVRYEIHYGFGSQASVAGSSGRIYSSPSAGHGGAAVASDLKPSVRGR